MTTRRTRYPGLLALLGALLLVVPGLARAASWAGLDEPVSGNGTLSRTTPSVRYAVQLPDGSLYAVWYRRLVDGSTRVEGGRRPAGGPWQPDAEPISLGSSLSVLPALAVGPAGELHVAWADDRNGNMEIYVRDRDVAGAWGPELRLTHTAEASISPTLCAAHNGWVHLAWSEGGPGHQAINVVSRPPGGDWGAPIAITDGSGNSENAVLEADSSNEVHLVWQDNIINPIVNVDDPGNVEIYYMRLDAAGRPADLPFRVSNGLGRSQRPTLAVEPNGTLHIFWCDSRDRGPGGAGGSFPLALWYRRALPGLGFGHEKRFVYGAGDRLNPTVAVDATGTINVAWEDYTGGNPDIYFRQITPTTGWDPFNTRLTSSVAASQGPCLLAEPGGTLHLLWSDLQSADDLNVYYRQGQAHATTPVTMGEIALSADAEGLSIDWQTTAESDHAGFQVYGAPTSDADGTLLTPTLVQGERGSYRVRLAPGVAPAGSVVKLVSVSRGGARRVEAVRVVPAAGETPVAAGVGRPYPNPSHGLVRIPVAAPAGANVELRIVDVRGRLVAQVAPGSIGAENPEFRWDGADDEGRRLPAGRYFARAYADGRPLGPVAALLRLP